MILWGVSVFYANNFQRCGSQALGWTVGVELFTSPSFCFLLFWLVCLFIFNAVTSRMATSCCRAVLAQAVVHKLLPPYRIGTVVPIVLTQVMSLSSVMGHMHFPGIWQNGLLWSPDDSRAFCSLGQQGQNLTCLNLASAASLLTPRVQGLYFFL